VDKQRASTVDAVSAIALKTAEAVLLQAHRIFVYNDKSET
jgi:hypothetical protein